MFDLRISNNLKFSSTAYLNNFIKIKKKYKRKTTLNIPKTCFFIVAVRETAIIGVELQRNNLKTLATPFEIIFYCDGGGFMIFKKGVRLKKIKIGVKQYFFSLLSCYIWDTLNLLGGTWSTTLVKFECQILIFWYFWSMLRQFSYRRGSQDPLTPPPHLDPPLSDIMDISSHACLASIAEVEKLLVRGTKDNLK